MTRAENENINNTMNEWNPEMMLEISLNEPDDFLKVKETLTRIGIASKKEHNTLYQSCHILHKQGRYFILHFKELFSLDGKPSTITEDDISRRNTIATLLEDWGLVNVVDKTKIANISSLKQIKIIPFKSKHEWTLEPKYKIGLVKKS